MYLYINHNALLILHVYKHFRIPLPFEKVHTSLYICSNTILVSADFIKIYQHSLIILLLIDLGFRQVKFVNIILIPKCLFLIIRFVSVDDTDSMFKKTSRLEGS